MTTQNPWSEFLEQEGPGTRAAYFSYGDQFGGRNRSQRQRGYHEDRFVDQYNRYLGILGMQIRQGQMPTAQWQDYLGGKDWDQEYQQNVPYSTRQAGYGGFAPQVRWDVRGR